MTKLNRRHFLTLAGVGVTGLSLSACAGTGGSTSGGGEDDDAPVEKLVWWSNHPGESKAVEQQLIDAFTESEGIEVELVDGGANYEELAQRFNAALTGGDLPDVIVASDVNWFNFALNEAITPVDELWTAADVDSEGYVDSLREDYLFNDQHYAMPFARSTPLFYFNEELWKEADLPDRGPESWEEFDEFAAKLKSANGDITPLTVPDGSNYLDWYFQGMIWTFGGAYSKEWEPAFADANSIKAGEFLAEQVEKGHIAVSNDPVNQFGVGRAAALLESTGSLGGLTETADFTLRTAFLPGPAPGCPTGGAGLAIPNGISQSRKEAAMKFIAFITNAENTATFSQATGYMPVRKDALELDSVKSYIEENPNFGVAVEQLADTQSQDYARAFIPGGGAAIGAALDRITTGGEDVSTVFGELSEQITTIYERDVEPKL